MVAIVESTLGMFSPPTVFPLEPSGCIVNDVFGASAGSLTPGRLGLGR